MYKDSGIFYDFTPVLEADPEWRDSFQKDSLTGMQTEDGIFGIPHSGYMEGMFYNQAILDEYDLSVPTTYSELVECVKTLHAAGVTTFALGAKDGWPIAMYANFLMDRAAGYDQYVKMCEDPDATMENDMYRDAYTKFQELAELGAFSESTLGQSQDDAKSQFIRGEAAMMVTGSWDVGIFDEADNGEFVKNVGVTTFPAFEDGKGEHQDSICGGYGKTFCIAESASDIQKAAAIEFIKFMNNSTVSKSYLEDAGLFTACVPEELDMDKVSPLMREVVNMSDTVSQVWQVEFTAPGFYDEMNKTGQRILAGDISVDDALATMESARLEFQLDQW